MTMQEDLNHDITEETPATDAESVEQENYETASTDIRTDADAPVPAHAPQQPAQPAAVAVQKPSWTQYAFIMTIALILIDVLVVLFGHQNFYTPRVIYLTSFAARAVVLAIALAFWHRRAFGENRTTLFIVNGWLGGIAGVVIAFLHFMQATTFINALDIFVQPIDSALLGLLVSYGVYYLTVRIKPLTKQAV